MIWEEFFWAWNRRLKTEKKIVPYSYNKIKYSYIVAEYRELSYVHKTITK